MRLGKFARRLLSERWPFLVVCLFVALISLPVGMCSAFVIPESDLHEYSEYSINEYNACESNGDDNKGGTCKVPSGNQITWIGDSYSVGARPIIESEFPGISFGDGEVNTAESQIQVSKTVSGENSSNPSGFTILKEIIDDGELKPYLVFALGTNDNWDSDEVKEFRKIMADHDDTKVVFVNSKIPSNDYAASNKELKGLADSSENYYLADWASAAKDEWFESDPDKIHPFDGDGYATWVKLIKDALPTNCSAGLVSEDANEGMMWNYFVKANIKGISDNPAAIAGIMGNFKLESDFDPFVVSQYGYYGLHQTKDEGFIDAVNKAGLKEYWGNSSAASPEDIKKAIQIELDWIVKNNTRFKSGGEAYNYVDNLSKVDEEKPENYSDLFLVAVEGAVGSAVPDSAEPLIDGGAMDLEDEYFASANSGYKHQYQAAITRREYAREIYDKYASGGSTPSDSDSDFSSTESLSSSGNVKYDMEDDDIETLARFALWKAEKDNTDYPDTLSSLLDGYEMSSGAKKGDSDKLMKYIKERKDYEEFKKDKSEKKLKLTATRLSKAKEIIVDGLRTTSAAKAETKSNRKSDNCPAVNKKGGLGAAEIAKAAALMSWPVQSWQTEASDYKPDRVGKCDAGGEWITYTFNGDDCMTNPRKLYKDHWNTYTGQGWYDMYMDCGYFVSTVLNYVGVADHSTKFLMSGQPTMAGAKGADFDYSPGDLEESDDWKKIENNGESSMKPGDVLISDGHVLIYVGEQYGGDYGHFAHASRGTRVGEIGGTDDVNSWRIYRYVGSALSGGGDDTVGDDGLTFAQAVTFMKKYGANKDDSSHAAVGDDPWFNCGCGGANCVAFSTFFLNKFTNTRWAGGNGDELVSKLVGVEKGFTPKVGAVFSVTPTHTGVILGKENGKWIVGHASCGNGCGEGGGVQTRDGYLESDGVGMVVKPSKNIEDVLYGSNPQYAYPKVDWNKISKYLTTGV